MVKFHSGSKIKVLRLGKAPSLPYTLLDGMTPSDTLVIMNDFKTLFIDHMTYVDCSSFEKKNPDPGK